jgi:hypothetical protein
MGWLRGLPIHKKTAGILAVLILIGGVYYFDWAGIRSSLAGVAPGVTPVTPSGVRWSALGNETDSNLLYDGLTRTFSVTIKENTTPEPDTAVPTSVTFTITLYRDDLENTDAVGEVKLVSAPTFRVVGDVNTYSVINKTSEDQWDVAITPSGGSARYERATGSVAAGGSKAFTVVVTFDGPGIHQATDGSVYTAVFDAMGTQFTLSMVVAAAVT